LVFNHNRKAHGVILDLGPGGGFSKGALLVINLHVVGLIVLHQSNHMKNMVKTSKYDNGLFSREGKKPLRLSLDEMKLSLQF
jgi:hypothetical protein